jgi:hypothetical protein
LGYNGVVAVGKISRPVEDQPNNNDDHAVVCRVTGGRNFSFVHDPSDSEAFIDTIKYCIIFPGAQA